MYLASTISYENYCSAKLTYLFYWKEGQCTDFFPFFSTFPPFKELYLRSNPRFDSNKQVGFQICFILKKPEKKLAFDQGYWRYMKLKTALFQKFLHHFFLLFESKSSFANIIFSAVKNFAHTTEYSGATFWVLKLSYKD